MNVVMVTCYNYRDTWTPFMALFERFYGGPLTILTDKTDGRTFPKWVTVHLEQGTWCQMLAKYARKCEEAILLMQDDFFLTEHVDHFVIQAAGQMIQAQRLPIGCIRLYPCPGADGLAATYHFGDVTSAADYRVSCQAAVWRPDYLAKIADHAAYDPADFEIEGTKYSRTLPDEVLAFRREVQPWPIEYLCTAVLRGKWNPDAKRLCDSLGINVDWSMRPMLAA